MPWDESPTPAPWRSLVFQPEDCQDSGPLAATQPGKWCELLLSCPLGWTEHSTHDESAATSVAGSQESCCLPGLHAQLVCLVSVELAGRTETKLALPLRKKSLLLLFGDEVWENVCFGDGSRRRGVFGGRHPGTGTVLGRTGGAAVRSCPQPGPGERVLEVGVCAGGR